jgi:predicted nucleotidyltransferase
MKFDRTFTQWYIAESVLDIPRTGLDPTVFQFPEDGAPIIHPRIRSQIMNDLVEINKIITILDYFIVGSILTPKYTSTTDIDVTIEIEEEVPPVKYEALIDLLRHLNGKLATGTMHPIKYYIIKGQFDIDKTEAAYDLAAERWLKEPSQIAFNVQKYIGKLKSGLSEVDLATAELRRDLIDFNELKTLSKSDIENLDLEVKKCLVDIEASISDIVKVYDNAKMLRKNAFDKVLTPAEIRKFGSKNNLPENILYKLLERYFYKEFALKLKEILNAGVDADSVKDIKKTFKDFLNKVA